MCLGIPGQVIHMLQGYGDQLALVDVAGEQRKVNVGMLPEETFSPGDWVIIHMGFVVEKTDKAGADAAMEGLELMGSGSEAGRCKGFDGRAGDGVSGSIGPRAASADRSSRSMRSIATTRLSSADWSSRAS